MNTELETLVSQARHLFPDFIKEINVRNNTFVNVALAITNKRFNYLYIYHDHSTRGRIFSLATFTEYIKNYYYQKYPNYKKNVIFNDIIDLVIENGYEERINSAIKKGQALRDKHLEKEYVTMIDDPYYPPKLINLFKAAKKDNKEPNLIGVYRYYVNRTRQYKVRFKLNSKINMVITKSNIKEIVSFYKNRYNLNDWQLNYVREQLMKAC
jgi:hypothetical protein